MSSFPVPTESQEAVQFVAWLRLNKYKFHHSPNETGSSPEARRRAVRVKREGVSPGWPDYIIIKNNQLVAVELKRAKKSLSKVSPEQREWLAVLAACGVEAAICYGCAEAIEFVESVANNSSYDIRLTPLPSSGEELVF
jgi:Holliday junction resolvase